MRIKFYGRAESPYGDSIASATVKIYLAGTSTPATAYTSVSSIDAVSQVTTDEYGYYTFYINAFDYDQGQLFDLVLNRLGYATTYTFYNIQSDNIIPGTYSITKNTLVAGHVYIPKGVVLNISNGITLTFSVMPEIGLYTVFTGDGTVAFPSGCKVYIDWWGDDLATVVSNIGAADATVVISDVVAIAENIVVPSNICLCFEPPGKLDIERGYTVTIASMYVSGLYQIFDGAGAVSLTTIKEAYPEWWGATGDGVSDDTAAIKLAITSLSSGGTVFFSLGTYLIKSKIGIQGIRIVGADPLITTIKAGAAGSGAYMLDANLQRDHATVYTNGYGASVRNITIDGGSYTWNGIRLSGERSIAENIIITGCVDGFDAYLPIVSSFRNIKSYSNSGVGIKSTAAEGQVGTTTTFESCWAYENGSYGIHIKQLYTSSLINCVGQDNTGDNIRLEGNTNSDGAGYSLSLINCCSEGGDSYPFNFITQRELTIISPRVVGPNINDLMHFSNSQGTVVSYSSLVTPAPGKYSLMGENDGTGIVKPITIVGNASGTLTVNDTSIFGFYASQLIGTTTLDLPSLNDGGVWSVDVTVPGAALGDPAVATLTTLGPVDWLITAYVRAANAVLVTIMNKTGGAVDLASGIVKVIVFHF